MCTGHGPYPPRPAIEGSPNVFINGIPANRQGDLWAPHCAAGCHPGSSSKGSSTVKVNGKDAMRQGDSIDCGSFSAQGSINVFIGG